MAHTAREKKKLLNRVRRVRGQVEALERALENEAGCMAVLRLITACRGAMNGLMAEIVEDHVRMHILEPEDHPESPRTQAAEELIDVFHSYIK
jgi:FrmR/RcnR family transcriptional regulator, repressor of frmRAB operon